MGLARSVCSQYQRQECNHIRRNYVEAAKNSMDDRIMLLSDIEKLCLIITNNDLIKDSAKICNSILGQGRSSLSCCDLLLTKYYFFIFPDN